MAAMVQPGFWFRGLQASVVLFYGRAAGGVGLLFRKFATWAKSRGGIKVAVVEFEPGADPRILRLLTRLGFSRQSTNLTYVR